MEHVQRRRRITDGYRSGKRKVVHHSALDTERVPEPPCTTPPSYEHDRRVPYDSKGLISKLVEIRLESPDRNKTERVRV